MNILLTDSQANLLAKALSSYNEKLLENKSKTQDIQLLTFYSEESAEAIRLINLIQKAKEVSHGQ